MTERIVVTPSRRDPTPLDRIGVSCSPGDEAAAWQAMHHPYTDNLFFIQAEGLRRDFPDLPDGLYHIQF
jgi:hypothetical protein